MNLVLRLTPPWPSARPAPGGSRPGRSPRHVGPVLGRGAQHGRAADVDVLDGVFQRAVGRAVACAKGYRLTTSRSMVPMPCAASAAMCAGRSRRASRPPWMRGCRVFTRPSSISGKPVTSATSVTGRPASASSRRCRRWTAGAHRRMQGAGEVDDAGLVGDGDECSEFRHGLQGPRGAGGPRAVCHLMQLVVSSLRRSVLRLMPSHSAALLWLPSACGAAPRRAAASRRRPRPCRAARAGSAPRRSLKYCSTLLRMQSSISCLLMQV
jgi:hypothetical protein